MPRLPFLTALPLICLPMMAMAAGDDTSTPPAQPDCPDGQVRDADSGTCTAPQDARLDDAERLRAVRALAYDGQYGNARAVLDAMTDQRADGVLTYRGFLARKSGDMGSAMRWYETALQTNPDNLLARSYMGQGFVASGEIDAARQQLREIRTRGGRGTWAEASLRMALQSGRGYSY